jgi:tetratricopeptide (TPR) repeat protein
MPADAAATAVLESPSSAAAPVASAAAAEAVVAAAEPAAPAAPITQGFWRRTPPSPPPAKRAPFLAKSGARGLLAEEEERLYNLRLEKEGEVIQELDRARAELLEEENEPGRAGKLCATPFGVDLVGILVFVALTGALVGGVSARSRKAEVERLNDQLRKINLSLRQQARAGTVYAPGLNYAPQPLSPAGRPLGELLRESGEGGGAGGGILAAAAAALAAPPPAAEASSSGSGPGPAAAARSSAPEAPQSAVVSLDDEEVSAELRACVSALREGKRLLKERQGPAAMVRFEKALMLAEALGDKVHEKRAVRGLAAAARLNGDRRGAIGHLRRVLALSDEAGEHVGDADACGNIADLYTELGQFERAAEFYDRYISRMATDGPV